MRYMTVVAESARDLDDSVNALIQDGWTPLGGVAVSTWVEPSEWLEENESEYVSDPEPNDLEHVGPNYVVHTQYTQALVRDY